jgi:hypothetical protein
MMKATIRLILLFLLTSCGRGVPVVGIDEEGNEHSFELDSFIYKHEFAKLIREVEAGVQRAVQITEGKSSGEASLNRSWGLKKITVGIGVSGELQAGPIRASVKPGVRFLFREKPISTEGELGL